MATEAEKLKAARDQLIETGLTGAAELAHIQSATSPTGESVTPRRAKDVLEDLAALEAYDAVRTTEGGLVVRAVEIRRPYRA